MSPTIFFDGEAKEKLRPKSFSGTDVESARKAIKNYLQLKLAERRQTDLPPVWKMTLEPDVVAALRAWSNQRCAFCEQRRDDVAPYRFRPPGYHPAALAVRYERGQIALTEPAGATCSDRTLQQD